MEKQAAGSQAAKPRTYTGEYRRQVPGGGRGGRHGAHRDVVGRRVGHPTHPDLALSRALWAGGRNGGAGSAARAGSAALEAWPVPHADQAAEIARFKRENERPRMERDILERKPPSLRTRRDGVRGHRAPPRPLALGRRVPGVPGHTRRLAGTREKSWPWPRRTIDAAPWHTWPCRPAAARADHRQPPRLPRCPRPAGSAVHGRGAQPGVARRFDRHLHGRRLALHGCHHGPAHPQDRRLAHA